MSTHTKPIPGYPGYIDEEIKLLRIIADLRIARDALLEALELTLIEQERATLALGWLDTPGMKMARAAIAQARGNDNAEQDVS